MKAYYYIILFFISFTVFPLPLSANETSLPNENTIREKIKITEESKILDDDSKKKLISLYSKAQNFLESIKSNDEKSVQYNDVRNNAPKQIEELQQELTRIETTSKTESSQDVQNSAFQKLSMEELQQQLNTESANLAAVNAKYTDVVQRLDNIVKDPPVIRKRIVEANQILEQLLLEQNKPQKTTTEEEKALNWVLSTQTAALRSELKMLDLQLLSQPLRSNFLKLQKEQFEYKLKKINDTVNILQQQVNSRRESEVKEKQILTDKEQVQAQGKHPLIQSLASLNSKLVDDISKKAKQLSTLEAAEDEANKEVKRITESQNNIKKKLEIAGLSQILGQVLLEQKKLLPDSKRYLKNLSIREKLLAESGLQHIHYQEELNKIKDRQAYLLELMKDVPDEIKENIQNDLNELLNTRRTLLETAINIDELYLQTIGDLDFAENSLINVSTSYSLLIDEHLIWLRSAPMISKVGLLQIPSQLITFFSPNKWLAFSHDFIRASTSSFELIIALMLFIYLIYKKREFKHNLIILGKKTKKISKDSLNHTWLTIFYTLLLAIPFPALLMTISWQLNSMHDISDFTLSVSRGMEVIVLPLFSLQFFRYICFPGGLSEVHFKWNDLVTHGLRKEMKRLMFTLLPAVFITTTLISKSETSVNDGVGRLFLLVTLLTFALFFYRLLKPTTGILHSVADNTPDGLFARFQNLWLILSLGIVFCLILLAIVGYVYTAGQLTASLVYTVWFIFVLVLIHQISVRWLLLAQKRYLLKTAYEKHVSTQNQKAETVEQVQEGDSGKPIITEISEPEINLVSLNENSTQLLNLFLFIIGIAGFVTIWSELLPALGIFEKIELWYYKGVIDGVETLVPVTLKHLAIALLIVIFTLVGAKRFPAIIEILLLQNTSITSGSRYTIITLTNYTILGVGFITIFNLLGAEWAKFQWLFAALSVGIGFGLQEIVANFISGLIILFERPIRVGDYVSVGSNEGIVTRIQIRATTILTYDRKELLVPNKEFITGQLINLSLSDPTSRIIIPVGVAYGSNVSKAKEILLQTADEFENILPEPQPKVLFISFGDNSLNLELRCYIDNIDNRLTTISEINEKVNKRFNKAGIHISFPQRDVHLNMTHPIEIETNSDGTFIKKV